MLWKIMLICILLGGAQWMHAHPDSEMTQQFLAMAAQVRVQWDLFVVHFSDYVSQFSTHIAHAVDAVPKPIIPNPAKPAG